MIEPSTKQGTLCQWNKDKYIQLIVKYEGNADKPYNFTGIVINSNCVWKVSTANAFSIFSVFFQSIRG